MTDTYKTPAGAWGKCWIVARRVARRDGLGVVHASGYNYERRSHWAVWDKATDTITDHTMRQFDRDADAPWVGPSDEWIDLVGDYLADDLNVIFYRTHDPELGMYEEIQVSRDEGYGPMRQDGLDDLAKVNA